MLITPVLITPGTLHAVNIYSLILGNCAMRRLKRLLLNPYHLISFSLQEGLINPSFVIPAKAGIQ